MEPFAAELRSLMNAADGTYYLSAAPQCPYPDQADESFIDGQVYFDWLQVQFYNNYCDVDNFENSNDWDFSTWDNWAHTVSLNHNAKILLGIPANTGAAGPGSYVSGTLLANAIASSKSYSSFGGVMMWDMSQLYANTGFEAQVLSDLGAPSSSHPTSTTSSSAPPRTTMSTVTTPNGPGPTGCPVAGASCSTNGAYACTGSSFGICSNGAWVIESCGSGEVCVQDGSSVYCDFAGSSAPVCT